MSDNNLKNTTKDAKQKNISNNLKNRYDSV